MRAWCNRQTMRIGLKVGTWKHCCNQPLKVKGFDPSFQPKMAQMVWCPSRIDEVTVVVLSQQMVSQDDDKSCSISRIGRFNARGIPTNHTQWFLGLGFHKCMFNRVSPLCKHLGVLFGDTGSTVLIASQNVCGTRNHPSTSSWIYVQPVHTRFLLVDIGSTVLIAVEMSWR